MDEWFENYAKIKVRPSSHQTYQGYIDNHIKPNIGEDSAGKAHFSGITKALQETVEQWPDRSDRE